LNSKELRTVSPAPLPFATLPPKSYSNTGATLNLHLRITRQRPLLWQLLLWLAALIHLPAITRNHLFSISTIEEQSILRQKGVAGFFERAA
jgi:hypothetical protein